VSLLINDPALRDKLSGIKLVVTDVDGVLTDGTALYDKDGLAMKAFSMRDGFGFVMAKFVGLELAVITGNLAEMVKRRLEAFNITRIKGGHFRKTGFFNEILEEVGVSAEETVYIGDDLFDIPVLRMAGISVGPADAHEDVLEMCDAKTKSNGGEGVVREVVEAIVKAKGKWQEVLDDIENDSSGGR
jgi:3-deoxy-D-manno-octulosonate 8-phosphate phosphatase (KDO 8-P phosphatase)